MSICHLDDLLADSAGHLLLVLVGSLLPSPAVLTFVLYHLADDFPLGPWLALFVLHVTPCMQILHGLVVRPLEVAALHSRCLGTTPKHSFVIGALCEAHVKFALQIAVALRWPTHQDLQSGKVGNLLSTHQVGYVHVGDRGVLRPGWAVCP